jgi:hypothetical protein
MAHLRTILRSAEAVDVVVANVVRSLAAAIPPVASRPFQGQLYHARRRGFRQGDSLLHTPYVVDHRTQHFYRYEDEMFSRLEPQGQRHSLSEYGKRSSTGYAPPGRGYAVIPTPERASAEAWVKGVLLTTVHRFDSTPRSLDFLSETHYAHVAGRT